MSGFYTTKAFFQHLWQAKRWRTFHSPYLFQLFTESCKNNNYEPSYAPLERQRKHWLRSEAKVTRTDFGAGSATGETNSIQKVKDIARDMLSLPAQCRFMSQLVRFTGALHVLELGTSLGITTAYLSAGNPDARILTIEGDPELAKLAAGSFKSLGLSNITIQTSTFDDYFSSQRQEATKWDLVFIDGDHRASAVLRYYEHIQSRLHPLSIVIVDDIYWSADMNAGWQTLIQQPEVTQSVDCFRFGLLFFNPDFLEKEHHRVSLPW